MEGVVGAYIHTTPAGAAAAIVAVAVALTAVVSVMLRTDEGASMSNRTNERGPAQAQMRVVLSAGEKVINHDGAPK